MARSGRTNPYANARVLRPRRSLALCLLLALALILHLAPGTIAAAPDCASHAVSAENPDSGCGTDRHAATADCHAASSCALYAPLEAAAPVVASAGGGYALPPARVVVTWSARPPLQPPQA